MGQRFQTDLQSKRKGAGQGEGGESQKIYNKTKTKQITDALYVQTIPTTQNYKCEILVLRGSRAGGEKGGGGRGGIITCPCRHVVIGTLIKMPPIIL